MPELGSNQKSEKMREGTSIKDELPSKPSSKISTASKKGKKKFQADETGETMILETGMEPEQKSAEGSFSSAEHIYVTSASPSPELIKSETEEQKNDMTNFKDVRENSMATPEPENGEACKINEDTNEILTAAVSSASSSIGESTGGQKKECLFKIIVIGELGSGKTSFIKRYVHQFFSQHYRATIGVDFALKVINWDPNTTIRLQLWDIAGQERFGNMTRVYYKEAVGAFIVFDVTRVGTFDAVTKWKQDLDAKVQLPDGSPIPCVLLANKCDQAKEGPVNIPGKLKEFCEEHKFATFYETSAKDNINVDEAAKCLVELILRNDRTRDNGAVEDPGRFRLDSENTAKNQKGGCSAC